MAVAALILGILSITVFWWLGFLLGAFWTAGASISPIMAMDLGAVETWPMWTLGLGFGVAVPLVGVGLGIGGIAKGQKGISIAGIVTSLAGVVLALGIAALMLFAANVVEANKDQIQSVVPAAEMEKMMETLDDTAFQDQMLKAMQAAADKMDADMPKVAPEKETPDPGSKETQDSDEK